MPASFTLSAAAVDIVAEALGVDCRRYPFQVSGIGDFVEERVRIAQAVFADLARRGLVRDERLDPDVAEALRLMARYRVAIAVMGTLDDESGLYARVSAGTDRGLLVIQEGQMFRFEFISPESLARVAVSLLPRLRPGHGQSVTITTAAPKPVATEEHRGFAKPLRPARTPSESQLVAAQEMLRKPRTGAGYFVVSAMDSTGRETRAPGLSWLDTEEGRYMAQANPDQDGGTFAPADTVRLIQQLDDLIESVTQ
ncbi:ESX secretion-associated protein EspG [Actinocrispum wychmicini]|uniref:ESAT-6 protein secretion system EspG family protein n=1 Tax=Actinocrispum wychmicini TaxID=1213861 RepID=A0A4R2K5K1_9PSEU|nr:ESX secretion-associated protein EspG [Actinocrispum wychmicini]TCO65068.1 ESAT-6 protein secretion system EspG family protein [Actinocrispum wychmicini]